MSVKDPILKPTPEKCKLAMETSALENFVQSWGVDSFAQAVRRRPATLSE